MKKIAVLGAGMVGRAIALDLANDFEITSFDKSETSLEQLRARNGSIRTVATALDDTTSFAEMLAPFALAVCAVPGFMGYQTLKAVIESGKNVVDISFFPEDALALDKLAREKNVTAIVDCGVAPGMSNLVLGYYDSIMQVTDFECMVGGLPVERKKPFEYKAPFSPIDVIEEYTRPARFIEDGVVVTRPALSDAGIVELEGRAPLKLESFNTDGLRSLLFTMRHIPNMKEKTLRYPGHIGIIRNFIEAGFFDTQKISVGGCEVSPLEVSSALLIKQWRLEPGEAEFTIMRIRLSGEEQGQAKTITYDLYDEYDPATRTSSMARTTGYTCTAAVNLVMNGIFDRIGLFPPEWVAREKDCFKFILDYLANRKVKYRVQID